MRTVLYSMEDFGHGGLSFEQFRQAVRLSFELADKAAREKQIKTFSTVQEIGQLFDRIDTSGTQTLSLAEIEGYMVRCWESCGESCGVRGGD